ncbi:MAG: hypothetical protein AVDCRST_MAG36-624, partial [uncultured Nocardioidaceae bacterium]
APSARRQSHRPSLEVGRRRRLGGDPRGRRGLRPAADRGPEQRGVLVAPVRCRVDAGDRTAGAVPGPERHPHRGRLRAGVRPDPGGPRDGTGAGRAVPGARRGRGRGARAVPVRGRPGSADRRHLRPREERLGGHARRRRGAARARGDRGGRGLHRRGRWPGGRLGGGVRRDRHDAALRHARDRRRHPAAELPQPGAVDAADPLGGRRTDGVAGDRLPAGSVRRPDRERPEPGDPHDPGHRRGHRLRPAARRPLPRGAAPARGPARGDGVRAAPGGAGDPGQRCHGCARHALPAPRGDELDCGAGAGGCGRRRRRPRRHGDVAAGASRGGRALGLLAPAPDVPLRRADLRWDLGPRGPRDRTTSPGGVGGDLRPPRRRLSRGGDPRRRGDRRRGQLHHDLRLGRGPAGARRARPPRPVEHRAGGGSSRAGRRGAGGAERRRGRRRPQRADRPGRDRLPPGAGPRRPGVAGGLRGGRAGPRRRAPGRGRGRPRGRLVRGLPRHQDRVGPRQQGDHPGGPARGPAHPRRAAAGAHGAAHPHRDRRALLRCRARPVVAALRVRLRLRGRRHGLPALRVRVPGGAGDRLQHLPHDPGARGDARPRHPPGVAGRPHLDRRGHHLRRARPRRHLPRPRHDPRRVHRRARGGGRARGRPRHDGGPVGARHRDQPRPRWPDLVAEPAGPAGRREPGGRDRALGPRHGL